MKEKYIWLFGENNGRTANNNSFYFWKNVVNKDDDIEKYMILEKNKQNKEIYRSLNDNEKKHVIWFNSVEHLKKYFEADMLFVTLSYLDVTPSSFLGKKMKLKIKKPIIYLQHGTLGIKKIGYKGNSYNNNMFRFCIYNKLIKEKFMEENNFKDYQLYYSPYLPRYVELVRRDEIEKNKNQITWFITWRDYFKKGDKNVLLIHYLKKVVSSKKLVDYLEKENITFKICVHQFFDEKMLEDVYPLVKSQNIKIELQTEIDVMDELVKSKLLITDYSSIGFDFTFLNRPVLFFQPDIDEYLKKRSLYCELEELEKYNIRSSKKLIDKIISGKYKLNEFYKSKLPNDIDYTYVKNHKHIDKMYDDFASIQRNKITFLGYNFYGVGGTVNATKALAEGLLEKNYLVELISLKKTANTTPFPFGLNVQYLYFAKTKSLKERIDRLFHNSKNNYGYLSYDCNKKDLLPYCGYKLDNLMRNIKTNTLVSTRESLHLFMRDCTSPFVKNKVYFFHTANNVLEKFFPGIIEEIKQMPMKKVIFVTEQNRINYKKENGIDNYEESIILGNTLESIKMIDKSEIEGVEKKKKYNGIYLLRISKDRVDDINNLIEFGKYLKKNKVKNISLDVFGSGDYVEKMIDMIEEYDLTDYILYRGLTLDVSKELSEHDVLIDLSVNNSFGMTYIEAVLNGKKVFCMKNQGSSEVMKNIPNTFIESYDDLCKKINKLDKVTKKELIKNYEIIAKTYSREVLANKFIDFIDEKH